MNDIVSIIIPVYNVELYIEQCFQSIIAQTYEDLEVIFVDDCGQDSSIAILQSLIELYLKNTDNPIDVKILRHDKNRGLSAARNTGIMQSTGKWILFVDSDDYISVNCVTSLVQVAKSEDNIKVVIGDYEDTENHKEFIHLKQGSYKERFLNAICKRQIFNMAWNKLILKDFLLQNNLFFEENLIHEDVLWSFFVAGQDPCFGIAKESTYVYRIRNGSIQNDKDNFKHHQAYAKIAIQMLDYAICNNKYYSKEVVKYIDEYVKIGFFYPLWFGFSEQSILFYNRLRLASKINFIKIFYLGLGFRFVVSQFHYYFPTNFGYKWYRYFNK